MELHTMTEMSIDEEIEAAAERYANTHLSAHAHEDFRAGAVWAVAKVRTALNSFFGPERTFKLVCVNGHDRCYEGPSETCPYCELRPK